MGVRKKMRQNVPDEMVKYLVREGGGGRFGGGNGGAFVIEVPAHWKLTFASVNPNSQSQPGGYCLRVYEGEKLRAVYCDVVAFRDLSIPMAREIRKETGSSSWESDSDGNFSDSRTVKVDRQLVSEVNEIVDADEAFGDTDV